MMSNTLYYLNHSNLAISHIYKSIIDQFIPLRVTRWSFHDIAFRFFVCQGYCWYLKDNDNLQQYTAQGTLSSNELLSAHIVLICVLQCIYIHKLQLNDANSQYFVWANERRHQYYTAVTYFTYGILFDIQLTFQRQDFRLRDAHHQMRKNTRNSMVVAIFKLDER